MYDKIHHDYLWETIQVFNLPPIFISSIKALYSHAHMQVAINSVLSQPFKVTRGVRQGDPLSCLLFDIAIEPLTCMLRNNQGILGLAIPGTNKKLVVNMFADNTTLYLSELNNFDHVEKILHQWCDVSGARFNLEKTEIVPIGNNDHRLTIANTRKINPQDLTPLNDKIHIARDGEAVRSLGVWIGNKSHDLTPWEITLDKIKKKLDLWNKGRPTLHGKRTIVQTFIGGHTQYLTKGQGMPAHIEMTITKLTHNFIWSDEMTPRLALNYLYKPIEEGSINLLDIHARNQAIEITWLKEYLNLMPLRPMWATVMDILINRAAPPHMSALARINTFIQSWDPPMRGNCT